MIEPLKTVGSSYVPEKPAPDTTDYVGIGNAINAVGAAMLADWQTDETGARWDQVVSTMTTALQSGHLRGGYLFGASISGMAPEKWSLCDRGWFRTRKFRPFGGPSEAWLFVSRRSLKSFLATLRQAEHGQTSSPFDFSHSEKRWPLFDATIWVATGGQPTTTGEIASGDLDDVGARLLFARLDELGIHAPKVTGIVPSLQVRSTVGILSWERVHTGWLGSEGHRVMFYEAPDGQMHAELILYRHTEPSYIDLRIDRDDLLALFPAKERAAGAMGGPRTVEALTDETRAADFFYEMMDATPGERLYDRHDMEAQAKARWPSLGRNALRRARKAALKRGSGRFEVWTKA